MRLSHKYITILLFVLIFATRLPYISNSPFEAGESWRQGDTESMARNFLEGRFNILYPQLNYDGAAPNYAQLELQVTTFLIALLYKVFGYHYELARLIPILFFVGSAFFLYLISKKFYTTEVAWITVFVYSFFPLNLFYSRAIMPESAALFFTLGALYFFISWIANEKNRTILLAAIMTALAILTKIPAIFIGIPMLIISLVKYKSKIFTKWQLWLFALFSLGIPFLYFKWLEKVAEFTFVSGIGGKHIIPEFATAFYSKGAIEFFLKHLPQSFTWIGLILVLVGIFLINWKKELPIGIWFLAMLLEVLTIVAVIKFNYYLIFIGPVLALLVGKALHSLLKWKFGLIPVVGLLLVMTVSGYKGLEARYAEKDTILQQAAYVKKYTNKEDLIVIGTFSPELINASERYGWRANINYYDYIPTGPEEELEYFIAHGAKYFVPNKGFIYGDTDRTYRTYLEENFKKVEVVEDQDYSFYLLERK